jgi:hypothetical protein
MFSTPYSLLNRLMADALLWLLDGRNKPDDIDESLTRAEDEARTRDHDNPEFWNGVALADIALGRELLKGRIDGDVQREMIAAYLRPWRRGGSALKFASVLEQFEFLMAILAREPGTAPDVTRDALCAGLNAILTQLRAATGVA